MKVRYHLYVPAALTPDKMTLGPLQSRPVGQALQIVNFLLHVKSNVLSHSYAPLVYR